MSEPMDLDEARAVLADNGIDGPDLPYNPRALHAMRIADALLAEVERLRAANANLIHNAEVLADEIVSAHRGICEIDHSPPLHYDGGDHR